MTSKYKIADFDPILELVRRHCKHDRIENFLREAKKVNSDVKSSGSSDEIVFQHMKEAILGDVTMADAVVDMLVDSEESGQQHVFLYKPKSEKVRSDSSNAELIASQLFGASWRRDMGFPLVLARPSKERWADFRIGPIGTLGEGWTAKLYAGKLRWESQGKTPQDAETQIEVWKHRLSRDVKLVQWHSDGMLELRVPQEAKRSELLESVSGLWNSFGDSLRETDFLPYDLNPACMKLIENHQDFAKLCRLGDARVQDDQRGSARFAPPSGRDHLMSNVTREQAIRLYRMCNELVVTWFLERESHDCSGELRTTIGKFGAHNLHIRARTTGRAIKHVTDQLRRLV